MEKSLRGRRYGWRPQVIRFMLAVRLASLGVLFNGGSVRVGREETVVSRTRSMMARRARINFVGLWIEGQLILCTRYLARQRSLRSTEMREDFGVGPALV